MILTVPEGRLLDLGAAPSPADDGTAANCAANVGVADLQRLRRYFAALWLSYDVADLMLRGTVTNFFGDMPATIQILAAQMVLLFAQLGVICGYRPRSLLAVAALARALEAQAFGLNDFVYYTLMAALLAVVPDNRTGQRILLSQTAWLYAATAWLKLNGDWLSGGHLYVRQNYLAEIVGWPYPGWYRAAIAELPANALLAILGVLGEDSLALLLAHLAWRPGGAGRWRQRGAQGLSLALHAYAALALNVWFFGASMVLQVVALNPVRRSHGR